MYEWLIRLDDRYPWLVFVVAPFLGASLSGVIAMLAWLASFPF